MDDLASRPTTSRGHGDETFYRSLGDLPAAINDATRVVRPVGERASKRVRLRLRIESRRERARLRHGGILPFVARKALARRAEARASSDRLLRA